MKQGLRRGQSRIHGEGSCALRDFKRGEVIEERPAYAHLMNFSHRPNVRRDKNSVWKEIHVHKGSLHYTNPAEKGVPYVGQPSYLVKVKKPYVLLYNLGLLRATRSIKRGEELVVEYGNLSSLQAHEWFSCNCGYCPKKKGKKA